MIVTNPRTVTTAALRAYAYEPGIALASGAGLDFVVRILAGAPALLQPGGRQLVCEIGDGRRARWNAPTREWIS